MALQEVEILSVNTKQSTTNIAQLRAEIKQLKSELLNLDEGTEEYNKKLIEVGDKTHQLKEIQEQVSATTTDFGDRISAVQGTVAGLSGAFQTVIGSLSLMGVEMGDDVKVLKTLQSAMAITQGVAAIDAGVKAFKALSISIKASTAAMSGLKKAFIASGIGAAAVAVGVLVSHLSNLRQKQEEAAEATRKHNEELREQLKLDNQIAKAESDYYNQQYKQVAIVQGVEKRLAENRAYWQEEYKKGNIDAYTLDTKLTAERDKYITNAGKRMQESYKTILEHNTDDTWKASEEGQRVWKEYYQWRMVAAYGDLDAQKVVMQEWEEFTKKKAENIKAAVAETNKTLTPLAAVENYTPDNSDDTKPQREKMAQDAELQALTEYYTQKADIVINNETNVEEQLLALDASYLDKREELLRQRFEDGLITEDEFNNELAQMELERAESEIANEERVTKKTQDEIAKRKAAQMAYVQAMQSMAGSISSILGSIGSTLEEGTDQWKAVMYAQAIIDTISGGIAAFMGMVKSIPGPWGIAAGAVAAAGVVASGMVEAMKIKNTKVDSAGGSSGTSFSSASASAVSVNATQVATTRNVATEEDVANMPDTKVYVTEEDITDAQKRVKVTNQNATY